MALPVSQEGPPEAQEQQETPSSSRGSHRKQDGGQLLASPRTPLVGTSAASSSSAPGPSSASSSSSVRRALKRKSPAVGEWASSETLPSSVTFAAALAAAADLDEEAKVKVPKVEDYASTIEALRRHHCAELLERERRLDPQATVRSLRAKMRLDFKKLTAKQKEKLARRAAEQSTTEVKADLLARAELYKLEHEEGGHRRDRSRWLCAKSFLLTWNHRTWVFRQESGAFAHLEQAVEYVRKSARANAIWDQFVKEQQKTLAKLHLEALTLAAELCVESFEECGRTEVKLHLHSFGHVAVGKLQCQTADDAGHMFWGVRPFNNTVPGVTFRGDRGAGGKEKSDDKGQVWAGHYYLTCDAKLGGVWSWSSKRVFKDYRVRPQWLTAWISVGAMSFLRFPHLINPVRRAGLCLNIGFSMGFVNFEV